MIIPIALGDAILPLFWSKVEVSDGPALYVSHLTAVVLTERPPKDSVTTAKYWLNNQVLKKTPEGISLVESLTRL